VPGGPRRHSRPCNGSSNGEGSCFVLFLDTSPPPRPPGSPLATRGGDLVGTGAAGPVPRWRDGTEVLFGRVVSGPCERDSNPCHWLTAGWGVRHRGPPLPGGSAPLAVLGGHSTIFSASIAQERRAKRGRSLYTRGLGSRRTDTRSGLAVGLDQHGYFTCFAYCLFGIHLAGVVAEFISLS
jgi:hypothetical protein